MSENVPIRARRALSRDINPSLMLKMREEQGMSNREIAEQCGCAYTTVFNYIGAAGFKTEGRKKDQKKPMRSNVTALPAPEKRPYFGKSSVKQLIVEGQGIVYTINTADGRISADGNGAMVDRMTVEDAKRLAKELFEAAEMCFQYYEENSGGGEAI